MENKLIKITEDGSIQVTPKKLLEMENILNDAARMLNQTQTIYYDSFYSWMEQSYEEFFNKAKNALNNLVEFYTSLGIQIIEYNNYYAITVFE